MGNRFFLDKFTSLIEFANIYQKGLDYGITLQSKSDFQGDLKVFSSDIIFQCFTECFLDIVQTSVIVEKSNLIFQGVFVNITDKNSSSFLFNVMDNSTLSFSVKTSSIF